MYILSKKELKEFDINILILGDVLVVRKDMEENHNSDYFISVNEKNVDVTRRDSFCTLRRRPRYIQWLVEDITTRMHVLRRSKFKIGDSVSFNVQDKVFTKVVTNIIADENADVFYSFSGDRKNYYDSMMPEEQLNL